MALGETKAQAAQKEQKAIVNLLYYNNDVLPIAVIAAKR